MTRRELVAAAGGLLGSCNRKTKKTVAVIPKGTSHIFWLMVQAGAMSAGEEFGLDIQWNGPTKETEYSRQMDIVDSMIARRVDGIVLAACDRKALVPVVDRAVAAGIPVTIFDSGLDSTNFMSYVATDNTEGGRLGARALGKLLGGKGEVAVIQNVPGSISTIERESGFEEVMGKEFPGIKIVQKLYSMSDRSKAMEAAENIMTAHPALGGFFCSTEPGATGTILAVKGRKLSGKVKLVGFDANDSMIEDLRGGTLDAMVVQDPFKMGYEAVKTIVDKLGGKQPPKRMDLPAVVIDRANLDQPEIQKLIKPDLKKYLKQ